MQRSHFALAVLAALGCLEGTSPETVATVASIDVSPPSATLATPGTTVRFTAVARNVRGDPLQGVTITWISSNSLVAEPVDSADGLVRAVAAGSATIMAVASDIRGMATLEILGAELRFTVQPVSSRRARSLAPPVSVTLLDLAGQPVVGATDTIALQLVPAAWSRAILSGTVRVPILNGNAIFDDLHVDRPGVGHVIRASVGTLKTYSDSFDIWREPFVSITSRAYHTCGLGEDSEAYCWGEGALGKLGHGGYWDEATPELIPASQGFIEVSAGGSSTCGLTAGNAALCWGGNSRGQLGDSTTVDRPSPAAVYGAFRFDLLRVGWEHACGLGQDGITYCWGSNRYGELGVDSDTSMRLTPTSVSGGHRFMEIAVGDRHTCGLTMDGTAYCWGRNWYGALGDGTTTLQRSPVAVLGGLQFRSMAAGSYHTCGIAIDGTVYCWGGAPLGDGGTESSRWPVPIAGGLHFERLAAGGRATCGVTVDGATYCWGDNQDGQLGNGTRTVGLEPTPVVGDHRFTQLALGTFHSCGLTASGVGFCWGLNASGQLGDGSLVTVRLAPARVSLW